MLISKIIVRAVQKKYNVNNRNNLYKTHRRKKELYLIVQNTNSHILLNKMYVLLNINSMALLPEAEVAISISWICYEMFHFLLDSSLLR